MPSFLDANGRKILSGAGNSTDGLRRTAGHFSLHFFPTGIFQISMGINNALVSDLFRSYEDMEREVSQILGFRWYALNDKQFKVTPLNLNVSYYYEGFDEH